MLFISNFHQKNINVIVDIYVENVFNTTKYHDLLPCLYYLVSTLNIIIAQMPDYIHITYLQYFQHKPMNQ